MAITVRHTPVGALGQLALSVGQSAGKSVRAQRGLALLQHALAVRQQQARERAQEQAFALQSAVAGRIRRTPTSQREATKDTAFDRMLFREAQGKQAQEKQLEQLNRMNEQGAIDPATFEQNKLRIMGGQAVSFPRTTEPTVPVGVRRAPFATKLRSLQDEMEQVLAWKYSGNPEESPWGNKEEINKVQQRIQRQIDDVVAAEQRAFSVGTPGRTSEAPSATAPAKPDFAGRWEGQQVRNKETGQTFEWRKGAWNLVG